MGKELILTCAQCGKRLKSEERYIGRTARCPGCGTMVRVTGESGAVVTGGEEPVLPPTEYGMHKGGLLKITKQNDVGVATFTTSRILDQSNVQQLGEEFDALVEKHKFKKLVLNFDRITYMSSTVMGKLIKLYKMIKAVGGDLKLCNIAPSIFEIFHIMRFDKLFDIYKSEDKAVIALMD